MPMLMTPHHWQLFVSKQTEHEPLLTGEAASLNRNFAWIQEWCNHRGIILNNDKTKALVVRTSMTVNPPHGDFVISGVSNCASPNLDILSVKFDSKLTFEDSVRSIVSRVSKIICFEAGEACLCGHICAASLLLCICSPNP